MTTEPLAVSYLFGEDESTPNTFHLYEAYQSREGFEVRIFNGNACIQNIAIGNCPDSTRVCTDTCGLCPRR